MLDDPTEAELALRGPEARLFVAQRLGRLTEKPAMSAQRLQ
jgi:hypothetical protein